jgi:hypothetical protein
MMADNVATEEELDNVDEGKEEVETDEWGNEVKDEADETESEDAVEGEDEDADEKGDSDDDDGESDESDESSDDDDTGVDQRDAEISSLRQMSRALRQQVQELNSKLEKQGKALIDKDILDEEEPDEEAAALQAQRDAVLNEMVEMMELNPKYEDVKEVCTQENCDDVIEALAQAYVAEKGGDAAEVFENLYGVIWSKANPYKELYGLVKQNHPRFQQTTSKNDVSDDDGGKKKEKKPTDAPSSLSSVDGGGSKNSAGWTSSRIDKMSEAELDKVPTDIYEKYMRGTLD